MNSLLNKIISVFAVSAGVAFASIDPEMEGMEVVSRDDGTFLVGSPTFYFDRALGAGGIHSESEIWTPRKLRYRQLFNRLSILPSWDPIETPSVWMKTGNEVGDLIYQDFLTEPSERPGNRTPILEAGVRTPLWHGLWATFRLFQDDHYSTRMVDYRRSSVDGTFSFFGENWPMFSSAYGGLGFTNDFINASVLAGMEYIWLFTESSRWIPVHYKPRVESRADFWNFSTTFVFENAEYQDKRKKESGERHEVNGSILYNCGENCKRGMLQLSAGLAFRFLDDDGVVYTGLMDNRVLWPFLEMRVRPMDQLKFDVMFGVNDRDWLVQDSVEYRVPVLEKMHVTVGGKNIAGTRLNPLADTYEYFDGDTISLTASGRMNLLQAYVGVEDSLTDFFGVGFRGSFWAEYGAETFDTKEYVEDGRYTFRHGDVARINSWIKGVTGEFWLKLWYKDLLKFTTLTGFERIDGKEKRFEVNPSEFFVSFNADWLIKKTFRISHSLRYRSDAEWNLRSVDPFIVKGDWYWDVTFEQRFPKWGITLAGSIIQAIGDEVVETPNGNYSRVRFFCTAKKAF
ncbi:hypothetical protein [Fibrobacter sp. UWB12]|uniref:hypothetical protein n=1 Tax=Fibrobacter sp. UWB12 TaxID=1896203 RepID=UPI00091BC9D6|nr:hypothetical protein [Fibrobacter sp. UWB12]SHK39922.1 hypothetical protein SAMN05720759_102291 [Fibrobacter sp. UWB12]